MSLCMEQYLDNLQLLPGDLQRKLRLLRDLDQKSQKHLETGDKLTTSFATDMFNLSKDDRKKRYEEIRSHFNKAKSMGDEKVQLAMQTYEMVDKHIRRLDSELAKFESELKRSVLKQQQQQSSTNQRSKTGHQRRASTEESLSSPDNKEQQKTSKKQDALSLSTKKRKSKSEELKRSRKKQKFDEEKMNADEEDESIAGASSGLNLMQQFAAGIGAADVLDMPIDPNEPIYCTCRQVSYGQMIGCDNPDCPIEWFHFNCVGLTTKPKGKWFCAACAEEKKKSK
uniref:Inhibitor of growth protein n=1 Tax=Romanomermis culicivorax TaxID=13658 RepID=A0A915L2Q1_ROMCU